MKEYEPEDPTLIVTSDAEARTARSLAARKTAELRRRKWDKRFLALARHVAQWSKDPSTKCGAVIVRPDLTVAGVGFNGFPRRIEDRSELLADRSEKYRRVVHAEMNAILTAKEPLAGCTLYTWPFMTCERCAAHVIQTGIVRHVAPSMDPDPAGRWVESCAVAKALFEEAGVEVEEPVV